MLLKKLQSTFDPSHKIKNINNIEDFNFTDLSQMVSIGILLNEIILNAYKHAFLNYKNPQLKITLTRNIELIEIRIHDNGKGIPENDIKKAGLHSVGFKIIQGLVSQLKAQLVINNENGMEYVIKFKQLKTS
jgi:two-component sensor histidine kinase